MAWRTTAGVLAEMRIGDNDVSQRRRSTRVCTCVYKYMYIFFLAYAHMLVFTLCVYYKCLHIHMEKTYYWEVVWTIMMSSIVTWGKLETHCLCSGNERFHFGPLGQHIQPQSSLVISMSLRHSLQFSILFYIHLTSAYPTAKANHHFQLAWTEVNHS